MEPNACLATDMKATTSASVLSIINNETNGTEIVNIETNANDSANDHEPTFITLTDTRNDSATCMSMIFEAEGMQEKDNENLVELDSDMQEDLSSVMNTSDPMPKSKKKKSGSQLVASEQPFKFLDTDDVIEQILNAEPDDILPSVPNGIKNNVRFTIDFSANFERQKKKKRTEHHDDCGVWLSKSATVAKSHFLVSTDGSRKKYYLRDGVYCLEKCVKKKVHLLPADPQPNEEDILIVCRYYQALRDNPNYRKRTTWLDYPSKDRSAPKVAVVEYCGIYPHKYPARGDAKISPKDLAKGSQAKSASHLEDASASSDTQEEELTEETQLVFYTTEQLLQVARNTAEVNILPQIPPGPKSNVRFVIDNSRNLERMKNSKRMEYRDDCGAWCKTSCTSNKSCFLKTPPQGDLKTVRLIDGECYVSKKMKHNKYAWVALDPQPDPQDIYILHRYYQVLKADPRYKKRTSWFESAGLPDKQPVAVVEYCGEYPAVKSAHGNCKNTEHSAPYVRRDPVLVEEIQSRLKTNSPLKVLEDLRAEAAGDEDLIPRDLNQIKNIKYKKNRPYTPRPTISKEVNSLSHMVQHHDYVQQYIQTKGKEPLVILYSDQQQKDFQSFLAAKSFHVVGIDRIPCDGPFSVTAVLYRNVKVLNASTHTHPVMLGPILVHSDVSVETYSYFFCHLTSIVTTPPAGFEINIRGAEDAAIASAIDRFFPGVEQFFCTKILADEVRSHLITSLCILQSDVDTIVNEIFGAQGLVRINDVANFEDKSSTLVTATNDVYPNFVEYFMSQIKPLLMGNIKRPFTGNAFRNNSQAINNHLQVAINWNTTKPSDLVNGLFEVIQQQINDLVDSLLGQGGYSLLPQYGQHAVTRQAWEEWSQEEKDSHLEQFLIS